MDQRTITHLWVYLQYLLLFMMAGMALVLAVTTTQKLVLLATAITLLYTNAWVIFIASGQLYLFIPCMAMLVYFFLRKGQGLMPALLAGFLQFH
jgi:CHASE2 domain-containing sensor protein